MLIADIKGKLPELQNREDFLTSCVFSTFKYLGGEYLEKFLSTAHSIDNDPLNVSIKSPQYEFWPYALVDNKPTIPDVLISTQQTDIVIEAKFYSDKSGFGVEDIVSEEEQRAKKVLIDQLGREYYFRKQKNRNVYVVYVTTDSIFPKDDIETTLEAIEKKDKKEVQYARKRIFWTKWSRATQIIEDLINKSDKTSWQYFLASDLLEFLRKRDLTVFEGFGFLEEYSDPFRGQTAKHVFYKSMRIKYWAGFEKYINIPSKPKQNIFYT